MNGIRSLVTGGAGFIGSHVSGALLTAGHSVAILDNLSTGNRSNVPKGAELAELDVTDAGLLGGAFARIGPEVVFHLAAQIDVRRSVTDAGFDANTNILGTMNVLRACTEAHVRRMVFSSTGGALYGEPLVPLTDEETPILPLSPYGVAKYCAEQYISYYQRMCGLETVVLRYANVYGPRQDPLGEAGVVAIFTRQILNGETPVIYGDGEQTRDFVFVGDVAQANMLAVSGPQGTYNIGTGVETSVNDLVRAFARVTGRRIEPEYRPARAGEVRRIALDASRARKELGWQPAVSVEDGLAQTVEWYRTAFGVSW
jgi:UDP-glucose 4-epimerase